MFLLPSSPTKVQISTPEGVIDTNVFVTRTGKNEWVERNAELFGRNAKARNIPGLRQSIRVGL